MSATVPQHMVNLANGNAIRMARVDAKRRVKAGELLIADALELECCQKMKVMVLLCAQWRVAEPTARRTLKRARVSEAALVRDLTARQRSALTGGALTGGVTTPRVAAKPLAVTPRKDSCVECGVRLRDPSLGPVCGFCEGEAALPEVLES